MENFSSIKPLGLVQLEGTAAKVYVNTTTILAVFLVAEVLTRIVFKKSLIDMVVELFTPAKPTTPAV